MRKLTGSCHCGAVRYEAEVDLTAPTFRCNCTFCAKVRNWNARVEPSSFRLLEGETEVGDYSFNSRSSIHSFCRTCGVRLFSHGYIEAIGGDFRSVQVSSLDGLTAEELAALSVHYSNGLADDWWHEPAIKSYL
jgi:hypothetical protein